MKYKFDEPTQKIISSVVLRFEGQEWEFTNERDAHKVEFDKLVTVDTIKARDGKIVFNLIENKYFQDTSWSDRPVNLFDGD